MLSNPNGDAQNMAEETQTPTICEVKTVEVEVVNRRFGRVRTLTPRVFIRICRHIESGASVTDACRLESITYRAFRLRVVKNEAWQRRLKQSEQIRANVRFERACASIMAAGEVSWPAHAWWLERSYPHLFALRQVNRADPEARQAEPELPAEILAHHKALMLETLSEELESERLRLADSEHSTE
jgi:hypothetical protein